MYIVMLCGCMHVTCSYIVYVCEHLHVCMVSVHKRMIICSATTRVLATLARIHIDGLTIQAHATYHVCRYMVSTHNNHSI